MKEVEVKNIIESIHPEWKVTNISPINKGIEFTAFFTSKTRDGEQKEYVIKAHKSDIYDSNEGFKAEPRMINIVDRNTIIPVPNVVSICDSHPDFNRPFFILEKVDGTHYNMEEQNIPLQSRILNQSALYLSSLHETNCPFSFGWLKCKDGQMYNENDNNTFKPVMMNRLERHIENIPVGGEHPSYATQKKRFNDLLPKIKKFKNNIKTNYSLESKKSFSHWDYRYDNLLIDSDGDINAVIDWANPFVTDPLFNIARNEHKLIVEREMNDEVVCSLSKSFRMNYEYYRSNFTFNDPNVRERLLIYKIINCIDTFSSFGLWFNHYSEKEKEAVEQWYRESFRKFTDLLFNNKRYCIPDDDMHLI